MFKYFWAIQCQDTNKVNTFNDFFTSESFDANTHKPLPLCLSSRKVSTWGRSCTRCATSPQRGE